MQSISVVIFYMELHVTHLCCSWVLVLRHIYPEVHFMSEENKRIFNRSKKG